MERRDPDEPAWLTIGRELKAIAQIGLTFSHDPYDRARYERIRELAAAVIAQGSGHEEQPLLEGFRAETGYATPKVDVRAAVFSEGGILLVREQSDGAWALPGGWADVNESPGRERRARSGSRSPATRCARQARRRVRLSQAQSSAAPGFDLQAVLHLRAPRRQRAGEHRDQRGGFLLARPVAGAVGRSHAPPLQIERMFEHAQEPGLPTDFD